MDPESMPLDSVTEGQETLSGSSKVESHRGRHLTLCGGLHIHAHGMVHTCTRTHRDTKHTGGGGVHLSPCPKEKKNEEEEKHYKLSMRGFKTKYTRLGV